MNGNWELLACSFGFGLEFETSICAKIEEDEDVKQYTVNLSLNTTIASHDDLNYSFLETVPECYRIKTKKSQVPKEFVEKYSQPDEVIDVKEETIVKTEASESNQSIAHLEPNSTSSTTRRSSRIKDTIEKQDSEIKTVTAKKVTKPIFIKSQKAITEIRSWNQMHQNIYEWMKKLRSGQNISKAMIHSFFVTSFNALKRSLGSKVPRIPTVHESIVRFAVDLIKIFETIVLVGHKNISGLFLKFIEFVLGIYFGNPNIMKSTSLGWIQTKEVITLLFSVLTSVHTIYGIIQLLGKIQSCFVIRAAKFSSTNNNGFIAFVMNEINSFNEVLTKRLTHLANISRFGVMF